MEKQARTIAPAAGRARIRWNARASAAINARRRLPEASSAYFAEVRAALTTNPPPADLHPLRLATKRFRYTLELFRPCYGPALNARLARLRDLQSALGDVNDAVVVTRIVAETLPPSALRDRLQRTLEERALSKALEFRRLWSEFDGPGCEAEWADFLSRNAHPPRRDR
jgi:CHAD domain-containing protein